MTAGKFEVYEDKSGKFRFRLKTASGEIVAQGEAYQTPTEAVEACRTVSEAATDAEVVLIRDVRSR